MSHKLVSLYIGDGEYYTRTDADALISELEKEIDKLQDKVTDLLLRDRNMALHFNNAVDDLVHNKYKRCLAMRNMCRYAQYSYSYLMENESCKIRPNNIDFRRYNKKYHFYLRWRKRWMELAEKFKDTK